MIANEAKDKRSGWIEAEAGERGGDPRESSRKLVGRG